MKRVLRLCNPSNWDLIIHFFTGIVLELLLRWILRKKVLLMHIPRFIPPIAITYWVGMSAYDIIKWHWHETKTYPGPDQPREKVRTS